MCSEATVAVPYCHIDMVHFIQEHRRWVESTAIMTSAIDTNEFIAVIR